MTGVVTRPKGDNLMIYFDKDSNAFFFYENKEGEITMIYYKKPKRKEPKNNIINFPKKKDKCLLPPFLY